MLRYHKDVHFPDRDIDKLELFTSRINSIKAFTFSKHCLNNIIHRILDVEQILQLIKGLTFNSKNIFEYYKEKGYIEKVCYRVNYNKYQDIIIVMNKFKKIITIYVNGKEDTHRNLDKTLYVKA